MSPGGVDQEIRAVDTDSALDVTVRLAMRQWPESVVEDVVTGTVYELFSDIPFGKLTQFFIHKSPELVDQEEAGAGNLHVIRGDRSITIVRTEDDTEAETIVKAVAESSVVGAAQQLPAGSHCGDCYHYSRCKNVLGCTWEQRVVCDFSPSRFSAGDAEQLRSKSLEYFDQEEVLFVKRLREHFSIEDVMKILGVTMGVCRHCWDADSGCQCWNDE